MNEPERHHAESKGPDSKGYKPPDSIRSCRTGGGCRGCRPGWEVGVSGYGLITEGYEGIQKNSLYLKIVSQLYAFVKSYRVLH